jgi:hypothetical protein
MSQTLETELDRILDTRHQRRVQREAELAVLQKAIDDASAELELKQNKFRSHVRLLIQQTIERVNQHLGKRPEGCQLIDVSGRFAAPYFIGARGCNPIAYELRVAGQTMGEPLLIELTHDGMVEASLALPPSAGRVGQLIKTTFDWRAVPLYMFSFTHASDLLIRYVTAVTVRWPTAAGELN